MAPLDRGDLFPRIELLDENGGRVLLPKGPRLFAFFKTTCPTCEFAWPYLERIRGMAGGARTQILAVSQDPPEETRGFNRRTGTRLSTLYDPPPWRASDAVGLTNVPTFVLVGADGIIRKSVVGFQKQEMEQLARDATSAADRPRQSLFGADEDVPAVKPG